MNPSKWSALVGSSVVLVALNACSSAEVPEVPVEEQWRKTIHNFSLVPIYPMREGVFVGDVRLTVDPSVVQPQSLPYRNIGYIDLSEELEIYYTKRPEFPKTEPPKNGTGSGTEREAWPQPEAPKSIFKGGGSDKRLRLAALPGVNVATVFEGSVGARAPVQGVGNVGAGAAAESTRVLNISLSGIEELEAPSDFVLKEKFESVCKRDYTRENLRFALAQLIGEPTPGLFAQANPKVAIVSRVLYARSIDYTFTTDQAFGANVVAVTEGLKALQDLSTNLASVSTASEIDPEAGKVDAEAKSGKTEPDPADPSDASREASAAAMRAEVASLSAQLQKTLSGSASPGVAASATFVDARGVTLRQTFERPMAFAVQTVSYDLKDVETGDICAELEPGTQRKVTG